MARGKKCRQSDDTEIRELCKKKGENILRMQEGFFLEWSAGGPPCPSHWLWSLSLRKCEPQQVIEGYLFP